MIIGCDYHPAFQQIAFVDTDTGELHIAHTRINRDPFRWTGRAELFERNQGISRFDRWSMSSIKRNVKKKAPL